MCQVKGRILKGWKMANQDEWYCGNDFFCVMTNCVIIFYQFAYKRMANVMGMPQFAFKDTVSYSY